MDGAVSTEIGVWEPHPGPQTAYVTCPIFEVAYGGARGGGKTDGSLGEWLNHSDQYGEHAIGLMVRRTLVELTETIERSKQLFTLLGATFHAQEKMWRMANGARLRFAYLENDSDADNYQGHSYTRVYVEEAGNFPSFAPIAKLMATLRSGAGVPCGIRLTFNPGGAGHHWVKARYWDPAPTGWTILTEEFTNPFTGEKVTRERIFIPAKVTDNPSLGADYVANLHMSGSPALVRAWLHGDMTVIAGAYFPEFGQQHVIEPFEIPQHWTRIGGYDHGTARPFAYYQAAVADGEYYPEIPRGSLVFYREVYGSNGKPNEGLGLSAPEIAQMICKAVGKDAPMFVRADPSIFPSARNRGPSIAEDLINNGVHVSRADNARLAGWGQIRSRLKGIDGIPYIYFFRTCPHLIRTLPALQHDRHNPEDCDSEGEDHGPDAARYLCMSRPWVEDEIKDAPITTHPGKYRDLLSSHLTRSRSEWR
jgi:hypothetical protein